MKSNLKKITTLLRLLSNELDNERQALSDLSFQKLTTISARKASILDQIDLADAVAVDPITATKVRNTLRKLQANADDNLKKLLSLKEGAKRAQSRIAMIAKRERTVGAYNANGKPLGDVDRSSITSRA